MATLTGQQPKNTYKDLLQRANSNNGVDATLRVVSGGNGTNTPLYLSTEKVKIKPTTDSTTVFEVHDKDGNVIFTIDTVNNKIIAASGVTWEGNGANLTGITGATGGVSNTASTNIVADSDGTGDGNITLTINATDVVKLKNDGSGTGGILEVVETTTHTTPDAGFVGISAENSNLYRVTSAGNVEKLLTPSDLYPLIGTTNDIGIAGSTNFGVGICPPELVPYYISSFPGTFTPGDDNYGNYYHKTDGSVMVWIPRFYEKITHINIVNMTGDGTEVTLTLASAHNYISVGEKAYIQFAAGFALPKGQYTITEIVDSTTIKISSSYNTGTYTPNSGWIFNSVQIRGIYDYPTNENALAEGFVVNRMFINGGEIKEGVFVDKYDWSLTNVTWDGTTQLTGTASSIKNGNPISSSGATKRILNGTQDNYAGSFSNCISNSQSPVDIYGGAWAAAKSRGDDFAVWSVYIAKGLALLSLAHGQAATSTTNCAWYDASGVTNFPKGNNNYGADINDATCTFTLPDDDYWGTRNEARKTGSGNVFAKTTHNGQNCGVADLNGNQWKLAQGLTAIVSTVSITNAVSTDVNTKVQITAATHGLSVGDWVMIVGVAGMTDINDKIFKVTDVIDVNNFKIASTTVQTYTSGGTVYKGKFYTFKESVDIATVTGGNSIDATDHFDDDFILANMDEIVPNFADGGVFGQRFGNGVEQVIPFNLDRTNNNYLLSSLGLPDTAGMSSGGSNQFGQDYFYQYLIDELCPLSGGDWHDIPYAGVFHLYLLYTRTNIYTHVSGRSSLYV
jgi:hypothetical protein